MRVIILTIILSCFFIFTYQAVNAESPNSIFKSFFGGMNWQPDALNSESEVIGNYQVIVTTNPISPVINQTTHVEIKVFNYNQGVYGDKSNYAETGVNHFTMGIRVFYNDELTDEILPQLHKGDSWGMDYTFHKSGNYVLNIDLYDTTHDSQVVTYIFNIPVATIFGPIFEYILLAAAVALAGTLIWVNLVMKKKIS